MAVQQRVRVAFEDVFPAGAFVVGEVDPVEDYDQVQAAKAAGREPGDVQLRDKVSDKRVWQVRVVDADPDARKGQTEQVVKIAADVQPVPPPVVDGLPFRPVVFEDLTMTAYIDERGYRPRIAWSLRASGMRAAKTPTGTGTGPVGGSGSSGSGEKGGA